MVKSQQKDHLVNQLTVEINKENYYPEFEKTLKQYAKTAVVDGFRKGMVPVGRIKKLYGQSILVEMILGKVEKAINEYLTQEKISILGQPLPIENDADKINADQPENYTFNFEIGLTPDIHINYSTMQAIRYKIAVPENLVDEEIGEMQAKFGKLVPVEVVEAEKTDLDLDFVEIDTEGNLIGAGIPKSQTFSLSIFNPAVRAAFLNKKIGDTVDLVLEESFGEDELAYVLKRLDLEKEEAKKKFRLTVSQIKQLELALLDENLYKTVYPKEAIATEEEFRKHIEKNIEKYFDEQSTIQLHDQYYHQLTNNTPIDLPESFLKKWLQQKDDKPLEQVEQGFPEFIKQLKWSLINTELTKQLDIKVTGEDLKDSAKQQLLQYFSQQMPIADTNAEWLVTYADKMAQDKKFIDETYPKIAMDKMFVALEEKIPTNLEPISLEAFNKLAREHHH